MAALLGMTAWVECKKDVQSETHIWRRIFGDAYLETHNWRRTIVRLYAGHTKLWFESHFMAKQFHFVIQLLLYFIPYSAF